LLRVADELVKNKIHPTSVISGFRLAQKEAVKYIQVRGLSDVIIIFNISFQEHLTIALDDLGRDGIVNVAKTSMSSKIIGSDSEFFASMVVDSLQAVKKVNSKVKSSVAKGFCLTLLFRATQSTPSRLCIFSRLTEAVPRSLA
jgi:T-complex protein 1 subunit alpha